MLDKLLRFGEGRMVKRLKRVADYVNSLSDDVEFHEPGQVVRTKEHPAKPMTVDDALYEMELVGHDFFLFVDAETAQPAVAYRRRGWSYGVIKLDTPVGTPTGTTAAAAAH